MMAAMVMGTAVADMSMTIADKELIRDVNSVNSVLKHSSGDQFLIFA
jgi:hypothetical protein